MKALANRLKSIPLFQGISNSDLKLIAQTSSLHQYGPNELIFSEGQFGKTWYVIVDGHVKISQMSEDGREKTLAIYTKGDFFGQVGLSTGLYYGATARAIQNTDALLFSKSNFMDVILGNAQIVLQILERVSSNFHDYLISTKDRTFERVSARLARVLLHYATRSGGDGNEPVGFSHQELADIIGSTRETVSRTLKTFEKNGLLKIERKKIRIKNLRKLRQLL